MNRKELFFNILEEEFSKEGFKYLKSKKEFSKKEDGNEFILEIETWYDLFAIAVHLKIRIGEIENIKKKAWGKLYDKFITIGRAKSYLIKDAPLSIKTDTIEKVYSVAKDEIAFYHSFTKEYFKKHLDYYYLDKILNKPFGSNENLAYNPIHTSFLAIIVAKLTGNEEIESAYKFYRETILKNNNSFMEEYDLLVEYLKTPNRTHLNNR